MNDIFICSILTISILCCISSLICVKLKKYELFTYLFKWGLVTFIIGFILSIWLVYIDILFKM